jgi:quinol-cytochrome oxidoreductase complex cytochrome b subunit
VIVLLRPDATPEAIRGVVQAVKDLGLDVIALDEVKGRAFEVVGGDPSRVLALAGAPGIEEILTRRTPLEGGEPLWPHFALRLGIASLLLLVALVMFSAFRTVGLGDPVDAAATAPRVRSEWFLRPLEGFLGLFPAGLQTVAGLVVALACVVLAAWPFLDRADEASPAGKRRATALRVVGAAVLVGLLALGFLP